MESEKEQPLRLETVRAYKPEEKTGIAGVVSLVDQRKEEGREAPFVSAIMLPAQRVVSSGSKATLALKESMRKVTG
jgi:hypothetical protein